MLMPNLHQLQSAHVRVLLQDKEGYMWYGMKSDGLYRDDGYRLTLFRADFLHPEVQMNNNITAICEDNRNRLWVGEGKHGRFSVGVCQQPCARL